MASSRATGCQLQPLAPALRAALSPKKALENSLFSALGVAPLMWFPLTTRSPTEELYKRLLQWPRLMRMASCQVGTASVGSGECSSPAIKAQHRLTEEDRFTGLSTEGGNPGGGQAAGLLHSSGPARTLSILCPAQTRFVVRISGDISGPEQIDD